MSQDRDYIVRATAAEGSIRAFAITSRHLVEEARVDHDTSPVITAALGRLLSGAAMMGTMMKGEKDLLTIQIQCGGPAKGFTVTADANGHVKGFPNVPDVELPLNAQEIATRSAACVGRINQVYEMIGNLRLDVQYTTSLVDLCNQVTRECIDVTAYGAQVFSDRFLVMSDAERLAETRKVLDDLDRLNSQVSYIDVQAKAIKYNSEMLNTYF